MEAEKTPVSSTARPKTTAAVWIMLGALNALIAVGAGAYGWHALAADDGGRQIFMMGSQYQMWHGLALIGTGLAAHALPHAGRAISVAAVLFLIGILFFSGTLYAFGVLGVLLLPHLAPIGGVSLMAGWAALAWGAFRAIQR